jgi:hypothetical protein
MDIENRYSLESNYEEDDWENVIIPDLLERERKLIEERRKVEEADAELAEELFSGIKKIEYNEYNTINDNSIILEKKEKPKYLENRREKLIENQKQKSELLKKRKEEKKRMTDIYGEAEIDEYDELYGSIQDKY